jgi:intergrase/recombinase
VHEATRAERRVARERVARYYESELAKLVDRVEQAIARYRGGEIGLTEADDVTHRYSKATRELWKFCWSTGSGSHVLFVARTLELWAAENVSVDWWEEAERPRRRRR